MVFLKLDVVSLYVSISQEKMNGLISYTIPLRILQHILSQCFRRMQLWDGGRHVQTVFFIMLLGCAALALMLCGLDFLPVGFRGGSRPKYPFPLHVSPDSTAFRGCYVKKKKG